MSEPWDLFIPCSLLFLFIFTIFYLSSSVSLSFLIFAVSMRKCLGNTLDKFIFLYSQPERDLLSSFSWDRFCFGWGALLN